MSMVHRTVRIIQRALRAIVRLESIVGRTAQENQELNELVRKLVIVQSLKSLTLENVSQANQTVIVDKQVMLLQEMDTLAIDVLARPEA